MATRYLNRACRTSNCPRDLSCCRANRATVVLTHHQLVHTAAPNASPHVRYEVIFRLRHRECTEINRNAYTDICREWPGIRGLEEARSA